MGPEGPVSVRVGCTNLIAIQCCQASATAHPSEAQTCCSQGPRSDYRPAAAGGVRAEPALGGRAGADEASEARAMVGRIGVGPCATYPG